MAAEVGLRQVFHLLVVAYCVRFDKFVFTGLVYDVIRVEGLKDELLWMVPQFATILTQFLFQDYFLLSFLEDLLAWTPKSFWRSFKQILGDHTNNLFTTYTTPFSIVMCVNFWVIFFIDPRQVDEYHVLFDILDRSTNHVVHTHVIPILLVEMWITRRYYPPSVTVLNPYVKITTCLVGYFTVVFGMKLFSPVWPYPFFKAMTLSQWALYIVANLLLVYFCYAMGYFCNALVWGRRGADSVKRDADSVKSGADSVQSHEEVSSKLRKLLRMFQIVESR